MGTDIHLYVERRNGDRWVSCDTWEDNKYEPGQKTVPYGKHFFGERSYDTFAILADVRNGYGFAGCPTGEGFVPISKPKGLPHDMSPELAAEVEAMLEHTPSWLTVKELMDYDWTRTTTKTGVVNASEYDSWSAYKKGRGEGPDSWRGSVMGGDVVHISEQEMMAKVEAIRARHQNWEARKKALEQLSNTYCQITWPIPYYRAAGGFLSECLPRLWRLGAPEDVRIVFWFDS